VLVLAVILGVYKFDNYLKRQAAYKKAQNVKAAQASVTLIEGWDNDQIADYLQSKNIVSAKDFLSAVKNFDAADYPILPRQAKGSLEGFIFPDTYFIPQNAPSGTSISNLIIAKALDNFSKKITPAMLSQAKAGGMDLYKIITLASIIEKESKGDAAERATISGIFYNRLSAGLPLQSDATVDFITKKNSPSASSADLQIDSPYNTYKYAGLPPGPICNPSLSSITAALYPQSTDYMYFLTDPQTGRAVFAKTYDEQVANKQKYLK